MIYVPKRMEEEVKAKLDAYQKIKKLTEKISEINYSKLDIEKKSKECLKRLIRYSNKIFDLFTAVASVTDKRIKAQIPTVKIVAAIIIMHFT